jgi:antirestriction protein ArdC
MDSAGTPGLCATITAEILEQLRLGTAPWQKPWSGEGPVRWPRNAVTGKVYRGINFLTLLAASGDDPRWCTRRQAESRGWSVREGATPRKIHFYGFVPRRTADGAVGGIRPIWRDAEVFHARDLGGLPPAADAVCRPAGWSGAEAADRILAKSRAMIVHGGDRACYRPDHDVIQLPRPESFPQAVDYFGTALHELAHWTGHRTRLDRHHFFMFLGGPEYAREELRAEIASAMLSAATGVPHDPRGHASYVSSWLQALERDQREIFRAASDAQRIVDFVLAFDEASRALVPSRARKEPVASQAESSVVQERERAVLSADRALEIAA